MNARWTTTLLLLVASSAAVVSAATGSSPALGTDPLGAPRRFHTADVPQRTRAAARPIGFEENHGQTSAQVRFICRTQGSSVFLTDTGVVFSLPERTPSQSNAPALSMKWANGDLVEPVGRGLLRDRAHYFRGADAAAWHRNIPRYRRVEYGAVYPGVDLVFHDDRDQLEYDFVVAPDGDPGRIALEFEGAERIELRQDGSLALTVAGELLTQPAPVLYQEIRGERRSVRGAFKRLGKNRFGFRVGEYDRRYALVIDPVIIVSTYLGGSGSDGGFESIALGVDGSVYVTSLTSSLDYPLANPGQLALAGSEDVVVSKLDPTGTQLLYSTYLGGTGSDLPLGLAVDSSGCAHVVGRSLSTDYPVRQAVQTNMRGTRDWIISKLSPDGSQLIYSTYMGNGGWDEAFGVALDAAGNAYVTGVGAGPGFPTVNAMRTNGEGFLVKLNPAGAVIYGTYVAGPGTGTAPFDVDVDPSGNAYVVGATSRRTFPVTANAFQGQFGGGDGFGDAFLLKVNSTGTQPLYSSYFGGSGEDRAWDVSVDAAGNAYLLGETTSTDLPVTASAVQSGHGGGTWDAFVTRLSTTVPYTWFGDNFEAGTQPQWSSPRREISGTFSTFFGRFGRERQGLTLTGLTPGLPHRLQFDLYVIDSWDGNNPYWGGWPTGDLSGAISTDADYFNVYINGVQRFHHWFQNDGANTYGTPTVGPAHLGFDIASYAQDMIFRQVSLDFTPSTSTAVIEFEGEGLQPFPDETWGIDNVLVSWRPTTGLLYSTYLGGSGDELVGWSHGLDVDATGSVHVAGNTTSPDFPVLNAVQAVPGGQADAFAARLAPGGASVLYSTYLGGSGWESGISVAADPLGSTYLVGRTTSTDLPTRSATQAINHGFGDLFVTRLRENRRPVADAGSDQVVEAVAQLTPVTLNGTASSDADGDALTYSWSEGAVTLGTGATLATAFPVGVHTVTLSVSDSYGPPVTDTVTVTITDTTLPTMTCPPNITVYQTLALGAVVTYEVPATDNSGEVTVTCTPTSGSTFPLGTTTVMCQAVDPTGNATSCSFTVTVLVPPSTGSSRVTGTGVLPSAARGRATLSLAGAVDKNGQPQGHLTFNDPAGGKKVQSTAITAVVISGTHARILGKAVTEAGAAVDFAIEVDDLGKPGADLDKVELQVSDGLRVTATLLAGDLQISLQ